MSKVKPRVITPSIDELRLQVKREKMQDANIKAQSKSATDAFKRQCRDKALSHAIFCNEAKDSHKTVLAIAEKYYQWLIK